MEFSEKYITPSGVACTMEEEKIIDSFLRTIRKWNKSSGDLYIMISPDRIRFLKKSAIEDLNKWVDDNSVVAEEYFAAHDIGDS